VRYLLDGAHVIDPTTVLWLCLILPGAAALFVMLPAIRKFAGPLAVGTASLLLVALAAIYPADAGTRLSFPWLPAFDLRITFALDGLNYMYALLITFIGALILLYSLAYMPYEMKKSAIGRSEASYYGLLLFFMGSMLGLVMSANLLLTYVYWELTGVASFLLISYRNTDKSRLAATRALWVTVLGGLVMFIGFVMLYLLTGTWELRTLAALNETILASSLYPYILTAIFIGAAAKSVQVPFHIWLPTAMEAPTPVSAYLHSATMVAAGAFLIGRVYPILAGSEMWFWLVGGAGFATMLTGAFLALLQTEMKGILAYSTISAYGYMFALYGIASPLGVMAATFIVFNHALVKASLFLIAGAVTYATGKKDIEEVPHLRKEMPLLMVFAGISALSLAGLPLLNGFWMKEFLFKSVVGLGQPWAIAIVVISSVMTLAYSARLFIRLFVRGGEHLAPIKIKHPGRAMMVPVGLLSLLALVLGIVPSLGSLLVTPAGAAILADAAPLSFKLHWPPDAPLWLTMATFALGGTVLAYRQSWSPPLNSIRAGFSGFGVSFLYERFFVWLDTLSRAVSKVQSGYLRSYTALLLAASAALFLAAAPALDLSAAPAIPIDWPLATVLILLVAAALATVLPVKHLGMILSLSAAGYLTAIALALMRGPGVALTQILVETISVIIFLLVLAKIPVKAKEKVRALTCSTGAAIRDVVIAGATGVVVFMVYLYASAPTAFEPVAYFYTSETYSLTGMQDLVAAILVDFRALDTLGEITVVLIAAISISTILFMRGADNDSGNDQGDR
jgi:multicomponent Na+:H+ antiporter subunit A